MDITILNGIFNKVPKDVQLQDTYTPLLITLINTINECDVIAVGSEITISEDIKYRVSKASETEIQIKIVGDLVGGIIELRLYSIKTAYVSIKEESIVTNYMVDLLKLEPATPAQ